MMLVQYAPYFAALRSPKVETARQIRWVSDWITGRLSHPPGPAICKGDLSSHIVDAAASCSIACRSRYKARDMPLLTSVMNWSSREGSDDMSLEKGPGWITLAKLCLDGFGSRHANVTPGQKPRTRTTLNQCNTNKTK